MTDPKHTTTETHSVGDIVQVHRPDGTTASGTLVDDFADYLLPADTLGRTWAPPHRWAIALDRGTLVFADDKDITTLPTPPTTDTTTADDVPDARAAGTGAP